MFFNLDILKKQHKGRLGFAYIAATRGIKYVDKKMLQTYDIVRSCVEIIEYISSASNIPTKRFSLRLSSILVHGIILIYNERIKKAYVEMNLARKELFNTFKKKNLSYPIEKPTKKRRKKKPKKQTEVIRNTESEEILNIEQYLEKHIPIIERNVEIIKDREPASYDKITLKQPIIKLPRQFAIFTEAEIREQLLKINDDKNENNKNDLESLPQLTSIDYSIGNGDQPEQNIEKVLVHQTEQPIVEALVQQIEQNTPEDLVQQSEKIIVEAVVHRTADGEIPNFQSRQQSQEIRRSSQDGLINVENNLNNIDDLLPLDELKKKKKKKNYYNFRIVTRRRTIKSTVVKKMDLIYDLENELLIIPKRHVKEHIFDFSDLLQKYFIKTEPYNAELIDTVYRDIPAPDSIESSQHYDIINTMSQTKLENLNLTEQKSINISKKKSLDMPNIIEEIPSIQNVSAIYPLPEASPLQSIQESNNLKRKLNIHKNNLDDEPPIKKKLSPVIQTIEQEKVKVDEEIPQIPTPLPIKTKQSRLDITERLNIIIDKMKNVKDQVKIEYLCEKPINKFKMSLLFYSLLCLHSSGYVNLIPYEDSIELKYVEKGRKLLE